jgi:hypothetical protein
LDSSRIKLSFTESLFSHVQLIILIWFSDPLFNSISSIIKFGVSLCSNCDKVRKLLFPFEKSHKYSLRVPHLITQKIIISFFEIFVGYVGVGVRREGVFWWNWLDLIWIFGSGLESGGGPGQSLGQIGPNSSPNSIKIMQDDDQKETTNWNTVLAVSTWLWFVKQIIFFD